MAITGLNKGVKFGNKNSLTEWGIYLKSRAKISPPEPKTTYIEIAGRDGDIDASEALTGFPTYYDRNIEMEFTILKPREFWSETYSDIMDYMHGKVMRIIFDEAPDYYYEGRITVGEWDSENKKSTLNISAKVYPYKKAVQSTLSDWLWNPFNFESGIIRSGYTNLAVSEDENTTLQVTASRMPTSPKYVVTLTDSNPTLTWFQGTMYAGQNDQVGTPVLYTIQHEPTMSRLKLSNLAFKYAVECYEKHSDDNYEFLGYLNSAGAIRNQETPIWLTGEVITPPNTYWLLTLMRQDGGEIATSTGSSLTAKACMTVKASNNSNKYALFSGTNSVPQIIVRDSAVTITFRGNGTVSVDYQHGRF